MRLDSSNSRSHSALGVLLYEMAVGKMPFRGGDENELLWNVCYEQIHYPMFLSKELTKLLEQVSELKTGSLDAIRWSERATNYASSGV